MPTYKLYYFNIRGRAEQCRLLFAAAGVEYEDIRVEREKWPELKKSGKFPFGQMPGLEVDGVMFVQSNAIARYLANEFGLAGKDSLEKLRADMIVDGMVDMSTHMVKIFKEKDEAKKEELKKEFSTVTAPAFNENLEKLLVANNGGDGFFVGSDLTWADLLFLCYYERPMPGPGSFSACPKLRALYDRVMALPKVAKWIEERPKTDM